MRWASFVEDRKRWQIRTKLCIKIPERRDLLENLGADWRCCKNDVQEVGLSIEFVSL